MSIFKNLFRKKEHESGDTVFADKDGNIKTGHGNTGGSTFVNKVRKKVCAKCGTELQGDEAFPHMGNKYYCRVCYDELHAKYAVMKEKKKDDQGFSDEFLHPGVNADCTGDGGNGSLTCAGCGKKTIYLSSFGAGNKYYCRDCYIAIKQKSALVEEEKKKAEKKASPNKWTDLDFIDDLTYIKQIKYTDNGGWKQYDVLLDSRIYGWSYMVESADYMAEADLRNIGTVTFGGIAGTGEKECIISYENSGKKVSAMPEADIEQGMLSIGGRSDCIGHPVKICWYNQTNVLRFFTWCDDMDTMTRYIETVIRRNFGKEDEMKLAKPQNN